MSMAKYAFRFSDAELAAAKVAAAREGTPFAAFVRRAVADRVGGAHGGATNSAGLDDAVRRLAALSDQIAAEHAAHKQTQDAALVVLSQTGRGLRQIEQRLTDTFKESTK